VGGVHTLRALWAHRFHRPFDLWRDFDFLSNPCESAPLPAAPLRAAAPAAVGGHPDTEAPVRPARAPGTVGDIAATVRCLVAEAVELPADEIQPSDRLLSDLHLNSLKVAQLALRAAGGCGRAVPAAPLSLADVTVGDLAGVIDALPPENAAAEPAGPAGLADWHRALVAETGPADPSVIEGEPRPRCWLVHGHSTYRPDVAELLPTAVEAAPALLAFLPEDPADADIAALLAAARHACAEAIPLTIVDEGDTASGFLGTICMEHPELAGRLVMVPAAGASRPATEVTSAIARAIPVSAAGYSELVVGPSGQLSTISHRPLNLLPAAQPALDPADVVLVTGGARGIGVETAMALGRRFGVPVGLIGRADPDRDDQLRANLARLGEAGLAFRYARADVSDAGQVSAAVADIEAALGPVTALIHASGINRPARFDDLTEEDFTRHSAAKRQGLAVLLSRLDPGKLRIVLTYGSVIGRFGLTGEAHYALANGRMRELVRQTAARLSHCWVCNVDFTAWSGSGMGEQLGVIDQLARAGVSPLPPDRGVELLLQLLAARPAVPSLLVTGRLPQLDRAAAEAPRRPGRYLQRMLALVPGVEAVAETVLDLKRDAYLDDHRIGGLAVLPAVCALEAMAQAAAVLSGTGPAGIADSQFTRPVIVPDDGERVIRVCALRRDDGDIDVVLRSDETGYSADHCRCRVTIRPAGPPEVPARQSRLPEHQAAALYGPLFFHGPAFRLLRRFEHLDATSCTAILRPAGGGGPDASRALLGDVGRNDAAIHVLQACVPHRRLLPVGCDLFALHGRPGDGPPARPGDGPSARARAANGAAELVLAAVERAHVGLDYTYDVVARDADGRPVISWTGLKLRDVGPVQTAGAWPKVLLGPYLQRCTAALMPASSLTVNVRPAGARTRDRAPSGMSRPLATETPSRSHLDGAVLEVSAPAAAAACDWEPVVGLDQLPDLRQLVGWADQAEYLRHLTSEPETQVLTRLWTVRECLSKTGHGAPGPLVVQGAYEDGWVLLRAGTDAVASAVLRLDGETQPVAVAILIRESHACLL
jgi:enediyne polyketide synthase